jgi:hypothetical protein
MPNPAPGQQIPGPVAQNPMMPPLAVQPNMPFPTQQVARGQLVSPTGRQPFVPNQNMDPYLNPYHSPIVPKQSPQSVPTPEFNVNAEDEKTVNVDGEAAPIFGNEEVVEYTDIPIPKIK